MAVLGLADHLAAGPQTTEELAQATDSHAPSLARLLRTLAALGLCAIDSDGRVRLTPQGELLCSDVPDSVRPYALALLAPHVERAWEELPGAIRSGEPTFPRVHGQGFWDYLAAYPIATRLHAAGDGALGDAIAQGMDGRRLGDNARVALTTDERARVHAVLQDWRGGQDPD